jgi:hypothetical protein
MIIFEKHERTSSNDSHTTTHRESDEATAEEGARPPASEEEEACEFVAKGETRAVNFLRAAVLLLLLVTSTLVCVGVFFYTSNEEQESFEFEYEASAHRIVESFHTTVERRMEAIHSLATSITSYALATNNTFPFVTVPHFAVLGSILRVQADALAVQWLPLVTDENRDAWEDYALENRFHIDEAFEEDAQLRLRQDEEFGYAADYEGNRMLEEEVLNETILDDGTGFHPRIWSVVLREDHPKGSGPYLPSWQRR